MTFQLGSILGVLLVVAGGLGSLGASADFGLICWLCPGTTLFVWVIDRDFALNRWKKKPKKPKELLDPAVYLYFRGSKDLRTWPGSNPGYDFCCRCRICVCLPCAQVSQHYDRSVLIHEKHICEIGGLLREPRLTERGFPFCVQHTHAHIWVWLPGCVCVYVCFPCRSVWLQPQSSRFFSHYLCLWV